MNKTVKFKLELETNGEKILNTLSLDAEELRESLEQVKMASTSASEQLSNMGSFSVAMNQSMELIDKMHAAISGLAEDFHRFDTAMRKVNTMAGENETGLSTLKGEVEALAAVVPLAKEEIAGGLYQVISNGVPKDNWISFLEASSRSAVGGVADLGQAVTVTSTLIKNYGLEWSVAASLQDKIQMTAKNGVTSFEQLAQALPRVSGNAATLGVSIDELMATFATLTGVSGNTAEVSTQLAAIFTALVKPSSEAAEMASMMGVQFDAAAIKAAGGMQQFLTQLDKDIRSYASANGLLVEEVYGKLFGSAEALRALTPLTGELSQKFGENVGAMAGAAGTMDAAFADMAGSGESAMQLLRNKMSTMFDWAGAIASTTLPYVTFIAMAGQSAIGLAGLYNALVLAKAATVAFTAEKWASLRPLIVSTAQTIRHTAVTLAAAAAQKGVAIATHAWSAAQLVLNAVLTANPIGLVVMAIGALVAGVIYAYRNSETFRAICDALWASVKHLATVIWNSLVKAFQWVVKVSTAAYNAVRQFLGLDGKKAEVEMKLTQRGETGKPKPTPTAGQGQQTEPLLQATERRIQQLEAQAKNATTKAQLASINGRLAAEKKKLEGLQNLGMPKSGAGRGGGKTNTPSRGLIGKLEEKIETARKQLREAVSEGGIAKIRKDIVGYEKELERLNKIGEVKLLPSVKEDAQTLKEISANIEALQGRLETANPQEVAVINQQIQAWEKKAETLRKAGITPIYKEEAQTIKEIATNIELLSEQLQTATLQEATQLNRSIALWKEKKDAIEAAGTQPLFNDGAQTLETIGQNIDLLQRKLQKASIEEAAQINAQIKQWNEKKEAIEKAGESLSLGQQLEKGWGSLKNIGSGISSITQALEGNGNAWQTLTGIIDGTISTIQGIDSVISIIKSLTAATAAQVAAAPAVVASNQSITASNVGVAASGAMAAHSWMPFVGVAIAGAAIGAMLAMLASTKSSVPKFAKGGIAYGTTLGIFGEYAGASNNPEVVAPLDRLRSLLDLGQGGGGKVEFKISGRSLVGVLAKENHRASRNF